MVVLQRRHTVPRRLHTLPPLPLGRRPALGRTTSRATSAHTRTAPHRLGTSGRLDPAVDVDLLLLFMPYLHIRYTLYVLLVDKDPPRAGLLFSYWLLLSLYLILNAAALACTPASRGEHSFLAACVIVFCVVYWRARRRIGRVAQSRVE